MEKMRAYRKAWREKNQTKVVEARERNKHKNAEYSKTFYEKHKARRIKYINAHRKVRVKIATPPWTEIKEIREFYMNCPEGHHVDHIVPLRGKMVSGLHVLSNLQYLPAKENLRKSNDHIVTGKQIGRAHV